MAAISIGFEHDAVNDIYIAYPCCHLRTNADCIEWLNTYITLFAPLGRRVDAIFVLDMFSVDPSIGDVWAKYRAQLHERFTRHSVRVASHAQATLVLAATARSAPGPLHYTSDIAKAIAMILEKRGQG